eukprot:4379-Heterococcus_DN1.PRE.2
MHLNCATTHAAADATIYSCQKLQRQHNCEANSKHKIVNMDLSLAFAHRKTYVHVYIAIYNAAVQFIGAS